MRSYIFAHLTGFLVLLLASLTVGAYEVTGTDDYFSPAPLKGVDTVAVQVDSISHNYARYGLSADKLQTSLSQRLEEAGFKVISMQALADTPGAALLKLGVRLNDSSYYYSFGVKLSLRRKVALEGSGFTTVQAWSDGQVGTLTSSEFSKITRHSMELVDNFIHVHQQQNAG